MVVPGNLSEKICLKHKAQFEDNFHKCAYTSDWNGYSITTAVNDKTIVGSYAALRPYTTAMRHMLKASLVEAWDVPDGITNAQKYTENDLIPLAFGSGNGYFKDRKHVMWYYPTSSYDKNTFFSIAGFRRGAVHGTYGSSGTYIDQRVYLSFIEDNEYSNANYQAALNLHNVILLKYMEAALLDNNGKIDTKIALDSKIASEFDAKVDDGRPGSGKVLAFKTVNDPQYCYDKQFADVDKAIYNSNTNNKYGCNIIKVMEDVK